MRPSCFTIRGAAAIVVATACIANFAPINLVTHVVKADLYFADEGTHSIREANLDGSNVTTIVSGLSAPRGVAIDYATQQLYWTDAFAHVIQCSNLDGTDVQTVLSLPNATLNTIALDPADGKMFFSSSVQGLIMEANLNGTGLQTIVSGLNDPVGIAVDPLTGKVYWTGGGVTQSANLDGSDVQTLLDVGGRDISINTATGMMYIGGNSGIYSASISGSNLQLLTTTDLQFSQMGVDFTAGKIYWDDIGTETMYEMNLDGTDIQSIITSGLILPRGIAILDPAPAPEPSTLMIAIVGGLGFIACGYRRSFHSRGN